MTTNVEQSELLERIRAYVQRERLWSPGARLLVAVSGGPDSVALLDLLHAYVAPAEQLHLTVAHINHGLRAEAGEDAAFVERLAACAGLPFVMRQVDVRGRVAERGESIEEAARALRYDALFALARDLHADAIVTGHTADDQAETVLMRVLRGTGITGLAGMPPRRGYLVRPLLPVWRSEIEAYIAARGLASITDKSNLSTEFTRNRLRLELLPQLEADYAPRLRQRLTQLAALARQDNLALNEWTDTAFAQHAELLPDGIALPPTPALPQAIAWRLWRKAINTVCGSVQDIGYAHIAEIARLHPGCGAHLPGVRVVHEAGRLVFLPAPGGEIATVTIPQQPLPVPGRLCLTEASCCLTTRQQPGRLPLASGDVAVLDADAVHGPLIVRSWLPGDRYRPFGAPGSRKVQDIFVDAGVPRRLRTRIPLVLDEEGILWIAGFRLADRVKIKTSTTQSLRIQIEWELNPWTLKRSNAASSPNSATNSVSFAPPDA